MLLEVRKLLFSEDVIRTSLLDECAAKDVKIPNSQLQGFRVNGFRAASPSAMSAKDCVVLEFVTSNPDKPYEVVLDEEFVLGALIATCRIHSVPLPRAARKRLQMTDNGLALTLSFRRDTHAKPVPERSDAQQAPK